MNEGSGSSCWDYAGRLPVVQYLAPLITGTSAGLTTTILTTQSLDNYYKNEYITPGVSALGNTGVYQITAVTSGSPNTITISPALNVGISSIGDTFRSVQKDMVWTIASRANGWLWGDVGAGTPVIDCYPGSVNPFMSPLVIGMERQCGMALSNVFYTAGPTGCNKDTGGGYTFAVMFQGVGTTTGLAQYAPDTDGSDGFGAHINLTNANRVNATVKNAAGAGVGAGTTNFANYQNSKWSLFLVTIDANGARIYINSTAANVQTQYPVLQGTTPTANAYQTWKGGTGVGDNGVQQTGSTASKMGHLWWTSQWLLNQAAVNGSGSWQGKLGGYWLWNQAFTTQDVYDFFGRPWMMFQQDSSPYYSFGAITAGFPIGLRSGGMNTGIVQGIRSGGRL